MYGMLDITTSGMVAQRTRVEVATANLVNARSIHGPDGEYAPFRRRMVDLASGDPESGSTRGVHVREIRLADGPPRFEYDPEHPFANERGYVGYPDIDPAIELVNAMEAMRAFEANVAAAEAVKSMANTAFRLLA